MEVIGREDGLGQGKQVALSERPGSVGDMMQRSSSKQQLRGWFDHSLAATPLPENCITGEAVPG